MFPHAIHVGCISFANTVKHKARFHLSLHWQLHMKFLSILTEGRVRPSVT